MPRWSFCLPEALRIAGAGYPVSLGAEHDALAGGFLWNSKEHACIACLVNIDNWNAPIENGWLALDEKRLGSV